MLAVSIHSAMFQGLFAFMEHSTFNHVAYGDWKWLLHYRVHSLYKDTSLLQRGPAYVARGVVVYCTSTFKFGVYGFNEFSCNS